MAEFTASVMSNYPEIGDETDGSQYSVTNRDGQTEFDGIRAAKRAALAASRYVLGPIAVFDEDGIVVWTTRS